MKVIVIKCEDNCAKQIMKSRSENQNPILAICDKRNFDKCFECGADDCVDFSVGEKELSARIRALKRRAGRQQFNGFEISCGNLRINLIDKTARLAENKLKLSLNEYQILLYLLYKKNKVVKSAELWERTSSRKINIKSTVINTHIYNLRKKIAKDISILTEPKNGFILRRAVS